eukprot:2809243-Pyramimonas_sp.AAC.1
MAGPVPKLGQNTQRRKKAEEHEDCLPVAVARMSTCLRHRARLRRPGLSRRGARRRKGRSTKRIR